MVLLKRLYVENYKLFIQKEFDFSKASLSVFDGPNGYGKTSIFDAIELLITGKIRRVLDCESINATLAYHTVFFAKNSEKDVILKAEFEDVEKDRCFVLGARVKTSEIDGKIANPKKIFDQIEYFYFLSYDISIDSWNDYIQNATEIEKIRKQEFGYQNIEQFTLFHYIRQEDRLSYFKQSELSRAKTIESLLGISKESDKLKKIQEKKRIINKAFNSISSELGLKEEKLKEVNTNLDETVKYEPLLNGEQIWDKENVFFGELNQNKVLTQYLNELEGIESYIKFNKLHDRYFSYEMFMSISEDSRKDAIHALVEMRVNPISIEDIDASIQNMIFLKKQKDMILSQDYKSLNLSKINSILDIEDISLTSEMKKLNEMSRNQGQLNEAINKIIMIRDNLHQSYELISKDSVCPYCGYDWKSQEELETQFTSAKSILQTRLDQDGELYDKQLEIVKGQVENGILVSINKKIEELSKIDILSIYEKFGMKKNFVTIIEKVRSIFDISCRQLADKGIKVQSSEDYLEQMIQECINIGNMIPEEYLIANENYNFGSLRKRYMIDKEIISRLTKENFDNKRKYLQFRYYKSFDKIKEEIQKLNNKKNTMETIKKQISSYENAVKNAIDRYKKQIIDEIEIPFFVYSSRLLQSYQGGQGVIMINDGSTIRFTSPGYEHDILYTMSSGQLSAVLLSFSLALNKIYSGDGIKILLIDDPIQCMDDINMISFVELLRREFADHQIVLSTHEEDFSNFVRYKFKKYGLDTQAITLKDA